MIRVFAYFSQAGGLNALLPVLNGIEAVELVVGLSPDIEDYAKRTHDLPVVLNPAGGWSATSFAEVFRDFAIDLVLTDTISLNRSETALAVPQAWQVSSAMGIPSLAYVDCWWGYSLRFPTRNGRPTALPDCVAAVDDIAAADLADGGVSPERIRVLGSPSFQRCRDAAGDRLFQELGHSIRQRLFLQNGERLVLFVSQPFTRTFGPEDDWGFSETSCLDALCRSLVMVVREGTPVRLVILPHPEDDRVRLAELAERADPLLNVRVWGEGHHRELVSCADLVTGVVSFLLAESAVLDRPTISIQLHRKREDVLALTRIGAMACATKFEQLRSLLSSALCIPGQAEAMIQNQKRYPFVFDAERRWKRAIVELVT